MRPNEITALKAWDKLFFYKYYPMVDCHCQTNPHSWNLNQVCGVLINMFPAFCKFNVTIVTN